MDTNTLAALRATHELYCQLTGQSLLCALIGSGSGMIKIPAKTVVKFRVGKAAKDAVLGVKK